LHDAPLGTPSRPLWRGGLHLLALCAALPLMVLLAIRADGARARSGVIVYASGLCAMLAVSTIYHRFVHTLRARAAWQRADHATIFAAIGGTFTALAMATVSSAMAIALLIVIWVAAAGGALVEILHVRNSDRISIVLYIVTGWAGVVLIPALWSHGGALPVLLLLGGGITYTVGAIGFSRRWPTLRPATFSYHEVWHASTIAAAGLHLGAIWSVAV
jgi:hemolysin III